MYTPAFIIYLMYQSLPVLVGLPPLLFLRPLMDNFLAEPFLSCFGVDSSIDGVWERSFLIISAPTPPSLSYEDSSRLVSDVIYFSEDFFSSGFWKVIENYLNKLLFIVRRLFDTSIFFNSLAFCEDWVVSLHNIF